MPTFAQRAGRLPLALTFATIVALGACADDDRPVTAPSARPDKPNLAVGDVITVTNTRGGKEVGSLRWAVAQATGGEIIRFDPRLAGATITLDSTLVIANEVTIEGDVAHGITISGGGRGRVIDITVFGNWRPTKLRNVTITGGNLPTGGGAAILSTGPLYLEHSTVHGNTAAGAAILALGPLIVLNSTVSNNISTGYLYHAIYAGDIATIRNATVAFNSMGGIRFSDLYGGQMDNSIIANNGSSLRNNCLNADAIRHGGMNVSTDLSCGDSTQLTIADPMLASLADNGGPTMTHAVDPTSPAFNGLPTGCEGVGVDQRYKPRDTYCDIGSFESTDSTTATVTIDRVASLNLAGSNALVSGTVKCNRGGDQFSVHVQVQQRSPDRTVVTGAGSMSVTCTTVAQPWSAAVSPSAGAFGSGGASATAAVQQAPTWVVPGTASRNIKLVAPAI